MRADDLRARCPRCDSLLSLDEMGRATCLPCEKEYAEKYGNSFEAIAKLVEDVSMPIIDRDYEIIILQKGGWCKIRYSLRKAMQGEV